MERIAPLAKILAEANGIEWEQLRGTGAGGMVVEQDILDYLSRVMSGEAEPPSTPVDLPPPDWDGQDIPAGGGMFDAHMLSQAGVESDIADFVQQSRSAAPAPSSEVTSSEPTLSQDDFELDDAEDVLAASPVPAPAASLGRSPFDIPPLTPVTPLTFPAARVEPQEQPGKAPPAASAPASAGLGSLLSRLYNKESNRPAPQPELPEPPAAPAAVFASSPIQTSYTQTSPFDIPPVQLYQTPAPVLETPTAFPPQPVMDIEPARENHAELLAEPLPRIVPNVLDTAQKLENVQNPETVQSRVEPQLQEPAPAQVTDDPATVTESPFEATEAPEAQMQEGQEHEAQEMVAPLEPEIAQPQPTLPPLVTQSAVEVPHAEAAPAPAAALNAASTADTPAEASGTAERATGAVWFGTYLRRDADMAQLHDLRAQLSEALDREVPVPLLVARAAQRHAAALGLSSVAMRDMSRGLTRQVGSQQGLRDALDANHTDFDGTPDLLVVDAGALDMDDLHYPDTLTLSVGRVHEGRAALSLQGDIDPEKAARFLASVAETLEKPVILLV